MRSKGLKLLKKALIVTSMVTAMFMLATRPSTAGELDFFGEANSIGGPKVVVFCTLDISGAGEGLFDTIIHAYAIGPVPPPPVPPGTFSPGAPCQAALGALVASGIKYKSSTPFSRRQARFAPRRTAS